MMLQGCYIGEGAICRDIIELIKEAQVHCSHLL